MLRKKDIKKYYEKLNKKHENKNKLIIKKLNEVKQTNNFSENYTKNKIIKNNNFKNIKR